MRAQRRANDERKFKRAVKILLEHGHGDLPDTQPPWKTLHQSARRFAASRFGCNCGLCRNPRRMYRGKNKASLSLQEWRQNINDKHDQE